MTNLKDEIWITSKVRMIAETRFRRYHVCSHLGLVVMSVLMILASLFSDELSKELPHFDNLVVSLSVLILATSLVIYGFDFSRTADLHRSCYLLLQALERDTEDEATGAAQRYGEILDQFPNHAESDFHDLLIKETWLSDGKVHSGGHHYSYSPSMLIMKLVRTLMFFGVTFGPPIVIVTVVLGPLWYALGFPETSQSA